MASAGGGLTSGGESGASGGTSRPWRRPALLTALVFAGFGLVYLVVNATSLIEDRRALGQPVEAWQPWTWEATSFLAWLLLLPAVLWTAARTSSIEQPVRALVVHLFATLPVSLAHTAVMFGLRKLAYAAAGASYTSSGPLIGSLVYEYRKDLITYASITLAYLLLKRLTAPTGATQDAAPSDKFIEIRDGSRKQWLRPDEIDWVAAAGNYVELNGAFGTKLARRTLAEVDAELGRQGFIRVHRSRLVRKSSIVTIETRQSGDFEITLRSGAIIVGSRRYRDRL